MLLFPLRSGEAMLRCTRSVFLIKCDSDRGGTHIASVLCRNTQNSKKYWQGVWKCRQFPYRKHLHVEQCCGLDAG